VAPGGGAKRRGRAGLRSCARRAGRLRREGRA